MDVVFTYNHLHAEEYLYYRREALIRELLECIHDVDANRFLKISCDKANLGSVYYDQKALNQEIKDRLNARGWDELKISYYVTGDEAVTKEIVKLRNKEDQKEVILSNGQEPLDSNNQVDFFKEKVAVEVQFGKYFSVAYDLHVKHTFFYLRDDIEVGIEIIPTHRMMSCMDTGVSWFENEVTNVIREGRNNPSVPIYILGIESSDIISTDPNDYSDSALRAILARSSLEKLTVQIAKEKPAEQQKWEKKIQAAEEKLERAEGALNELHAEAVRLFDAGYDNQAAAVRRVESRQVKAAEKRDAAREKLRYVRNNCPPKLSRILRIESVL